MGNYHSVTLDKSRCIGCTDCIKRCPTEAIRVRHSKAEITDDRCIDCGMCIRVCNSHAKRLLQILWTRLINSNTRLPFRHQHSILNSKKTKKYPNQ